MSAVYGLNSLLRLAREHLAAGRRVQVAGVSESLAQLTVLAQLQQLLKKQAAWGRLVIVLPSAKEVSAWTPFLEHTLASLNSLFPTSAAAAAAILPYYACYGADRFINPSLARRQRLLALNLMASGRPAVIVTTAQALAQKTLSPAHLAAASVHLKANEERDQDELAAALVDLGYVAVATVEDEGTFVIRGGIVDIFPLNTDEPVRLEFLGDQIVSIRHFNPEDQRSRVALDSVVIGPAVEALTPAARRKQDVQTLFNTLIDQDIKAVDRDGMIAAFQQGVHFAGFDMFAPLFRSSEDEGICALDYLGPDSLLIYPHAEQPCIDAFTDYFNEQQLLFEQDRVKQRPSLPPLRHFVIPEALAQGLRRQKLVMEYGNPYATKTAELLRIEARTVIDGAPTATVAGAELFDKWVDLIQDVLRTDEGRIAVLAHHEDQLDRLSNLFTHRGLSPRLDKQLLSKIVDSMIAPGELLLGRGDLASHAWLGDDHVLILPEQVLFGVRQRKPKSASSKLQNYLSSFKDLKVGDLVVHVQHGIARYRGMTTLSVGDLASDFLVLEYAGGDKIYMPVDRLNLLQRYSSGTEGGGTAQVDKLGGPGWDKRKARVKGAVRDMADELLKLQAKRAVAKGHVYGPPDETYLKFEAAFPYEETEDQLKALQDVENDLRSGKPVDRLICGDVGFGKTEVALRAAMRAVLEGYQVLVLVPTTVLCYQHYRTFSERLSKFGVRVAQANRFVRGPELKEGIEGLQNGRTDILIGTHRILSKDIKPKRLGLLVVDEEQRFGVTHKEKLKHLRAGADVITLTATPIPRTLHMAMVGLRDISIIATPPQDRVSVKTYIARFDESLIREAIEQEVRRGGQVFIVHNRVEDIEEVRTFIKSLVPHLDVRVGHGQMREHQLEAVIVDFLEQKFPVLVCTTIIESGIDMPNVNTLIVNRADRFGLAQLYQLRGRVGRSNLQAYAYFLTPPMERLSEEAQKRLDVLAAHQELGAGFQIASHDLEIRGAGNLLGGQQSGHVSEIGLELYTEMLEGAINEIRGEPVHEKIDAEIKIPVAAHIPELYVASENQRLHLYKSLFAADAPEDLTKLKQEIEDRFGKMPAEFVLLFKVARLKQALRSCGASRLTAQGLNTFEIRFSSLSEAQIAAVVNVAQAQPRKYRLSPDYRLFLNLKAPAKPSLAEQDDMLAGLIALIDPLLVK